MPDRVKEKLVELLNAIDGVCPKDASCYDCEYKDREHCAIPAKADFLIAHGVTVQELDGCEFCNAEYAEWSEGASHDFRIKGNALYYYDAIYGWEGITIRHCPMCGRKLPQPPKGE